MIFAFHVLFNLITAISYFWLPLQGYYFLTENSAYLPNWLSEWVRLFVLFVLWCGVHHLCMVFLLFVEPSHHAPVLVFVDGMMAIVSALAALKFKRFLRLLVTVKD